MYNDFYTPEADFVPQPEITLAEAKERSKHYEGIVRSRDFNIETGRYEWECLNYYNQIILISNLKKKQNGQQPAEG